MRFTANVTKNLNIAVRLFVAVVSLLFIYRQVFLKSDFNELSLLFSEKFSDGRFIAGLAVVVALMPVNWLLESVKWRRLIRYIDDVSPGEALKSVFTGITMSVFTPNRVGEFFGRVFTLQHANPLKGILLTIVGSLSQLMATLLFGSLALMVYIPVYVGFEAPWHKYLYAGLGLFLLLAGAGFILLFMRVPFITGWVSGFIPKTKTKLHDFIDTVRLLRRRDLLKVMLLSMARYVVFSTQMYLTVRLTGLVIPFFSALVLISMTYFVMTAIPTVALVDLGIRGSVSVYFLGQYFGHAANTGALILSASTLIWLINLALPALIGLLFLYRFRIIRKENAA